MDASGAPAMRGSAPAMRRSRSRESGERSPGPLDLDDVSAVGGGNRKRVRVSPHGGLSTCLLVVWVRGAYKGSREKEVWEDKHYVLPCLCLRLNWDEDHCRCWSLRGGKDRCGNLKKILVYMHLSPCIVLKMPMCE